jgi:drug/metabolite transporter (DMT)-like permease
MTWQILLLLAILFSSLSSIQQKKMVSMEGVESIAFSAAFQLMAALFFGIVLLFRGFHLSLNSVPLLLSFTLMVVLYGVGNVLKFGSLKTTEASEFIVLNQVGPVVTVILAMLFLGESFVLKQVLGLALVIGAVILVSTNRKLKIIFTRGQVLAVLAGVSFGAAFANDAFLLRSQDVWTFSFLAFLLPGLITVALANKKMATLRNLRGARSMAGFTIGSMLYAFMTIAIYLSYQTGHNAAQISSIFQFTTIVVVILAIIFLKERDGLLKKLAAAVIGVIGVILLK